jgi:hypothetical protein
MTLRPLATLQPELTEGTEGGQGWRNEDGKRHRNAQCRRFARRCPQGCGEMLNKWGESYVVKDG